MTVTKANARWEGNVKGGNGHMRLPSGTYDGPYSYKSRFESGANSQDGTNPEELIAAALSGCYSMFLAGLLDKAGFAPEFVEAETSVQLDVTDGGPQISRGTIVVRVKADGLDEATLKGKAEEAVKGCPVSKALAGVEKSVEAELVG